MAQNTKKKGKEGGRNGVRDEKERENFSRREGEQMRTLTRLPPLNLQTSILSAKC